MEQYTNPNRLFSYYLNLQDFSCYQIKGWIEWIKI